MGDQFQGRVPVNKIIPFSAVDGPGNRTAGFVQGCNFNCRYCHNPETRSLCRSCGECVEKCPKQALYIENGKVLFHPGLCCGCDTCIKTCRFDASPRIRYMNAQEAYQVGKTIGSYMEELNFNVDFAPVADIFSNPENTVIGDRAFGSDAELVAEMVPMAVKGLQSEGVLATLKHFPGQGQCGEDTHKGYVDLNATIDRLREVEFLPFESGIAAGADMVMMSHVAVSQVTGKETPASLTKLMVTDILREELQFNNVIITDAMNMKVITKFYDADQAAVMAVQAGNDMILMPDNFEQAFEGVLEAVKDGTISESKINEAVSRILSVKIRRGILPTDSKLFRHNAGK